MEKMVISVSGGIDSTTVLAKYIEEGYDIYPVAFYYGSKHNKYENAAIEEICKHYNIYDRFKLIKLTALSGLLESNLMLTGDDIPEGHYNDATMSATVVPGRNLIFISILAGYAESIGAKYIGMGMHSGDHHIYADCRPEFVEAANKTIKLSSDGKVELKVPFLNVDKSKVVAEGIALSAPYELTRTCYKDQEVSCGRCGSCCERIEAFELNGVMDPIEYESN
jgi:7-cyano-7-deazaguanine synthase